MLLVIGGPNHGELVNWNKNRRYIAVNENNYNPITGGTQRAHYYQVRRLSLFNRTCYIWLSEKYNSLDDNDWADSFLKEILSYKGGHLVYGNVGKL